RDQHVAIVETGRRAPLVMTHGQISRPVESAAGRVESLRGPDSGVEMEGAVDTRPDEEKSAGRQRHGLGEFRFGRESQRRATRKGFGRGIEAEAGFSVRDVDALGGVAAKD